MAEDFCITTTYYDVHVLSNSAPSQINGSGLPLPPAGYELGYYCAKFPMLQAGMPQISQQTYLTIMFDCGDQT